MTPQKNSNKLPEMFRLFVRIPIESYEGNMRTVVKKIVNRDFFGGPFYSCAIFWSICNTWSVSRHKWLPRKIQTNYPNYHTTYWNRVDSVLFYVCERPKNAWHAETWRKSQQFFVCVYVSGKKTPCLLKTKFKYSMLNGIIHSNTVKHNFFHGQLYKIHTIRFL